MKLITISGPPSSGKTSVTLKTIEFLKEKNIRTGVVKFDCLYTDDDERYRRAGIPARKGLSGSICPDHYFAGNIEDVLRWGLEQRLDMLISESAGLCNRCSPYLSGITAICVIDNLSGINTPRKIGPMLRTADIVVITKGDIVSQAEREVFASKVNLANPSAMILHVNGLTGQGCFELGSVLAEEMNEGHVSGLQGRKLRFSMPAAVCSYCLGETRIGAEYQMGNVRKIHLEEKKEATP